MGIITDPKEFSLSFAQIDWIGAVVYNSDHRDWTYDKVVNRYWIANDELCIQVEKDIPNQQFRIYTW